MNVGALQPDQTFDSSGRYEQWKYLDQFYEDDVNIYNLTANYHFESFQLTSSTSYIDRDIRVLVDLSSNNLGGGFFPGVQGTPVLGIGLDDNKLVTNLSQELRLTSTNDSALQWILGAYYSEQEVEYDQFLFVTDPVGLALTGLFQFGANPDNLLQTNAESDVDQLAFFGELNYGFTDRLSATAGIRYFDTNQRFATRASGRLNGGVTVPPVREPSEDGVNPKFILSYKANDDILLSLQASRGFRLGGGQSNVPLMTSGPDNDCPGDLARLGVPFNPEGFTSESLWNYELGLKSSWSENRVVFNASLFFIDYEDLQITTRLGCGSSFTTNAGGAMSRGFEFEFRALATNNLQVSFSGSYTDAEFTEDLPSLEAVDGDPLIFVPDWKLNAALDYNRPLSGEMNLYGNLGVQYTGEVESYLDGNQNKPARVDSLLDSYSTTNLRVGVQTGKWDVALFATNLFDKFALVRLDSINPNGPGGWVTGATIRPRTIGLNASYRF